MKKRPGRSFQLSRRVAIWVIAVATLSVVTVVVVRNRRHPAQVGASVVDTSKGLPSDQPFSLAIANSSGIRFGSLPPLDESTDRGGWSNMRVVKDELTSLSDEALRQRLLAVKPERPVLREFFSRSDWSDELSPLSRTERDIILIPQVHTKGVVDASRGDDPGRYVMACQTEIARFLIRQFSRGRFALVVEGFSSRRFTSAALVDEMRRAGERDWDRNLVAYNGAAVFGLNYAGAIPMASEGRVAEVTAKLWAGRDAMEVEGDPAFDLYNEYRSRAFAATAVSVGRYNGLPVFVVAGGGHMNGIQARLERWQYTCRTWVPPAYREYMGGRP